MYSNCYKYQVTYNKPVTIIVDFLAGDSKFKVSPSKLKSNSAFLQVDAIEILICITVNQEDHSIVVKGAHVE